MPNTNGETPLKRYRVKYTVGPFKWTCSKDYLAVSIEAALEAHDEEFSEMVSEFEVECVIQLD